MRNIKFHLSFSTMSLCFVMVAILAVIYVGLIAVVMSYAALTVEFSQSVRNDEAAIAILEERYLANISNVTQIDYVSAGYTIPVSKTFVQAKSATALR